MKFKIIQMQDNSYMILEKTFFGWKEDSSWHFDDLRDAKRTIFRRLMDERRKLKKNEVFEIDLDEFLFSDIDAILKAFGNIGYTDEEIRIAINKGYW